MIDRIYICGDSVGIRTPNLLIRSQVLYPIELQNRSLLRLQMYNFIESVLHKMKNSSNYISIPRCGLCKRLVFWPVTLMLNATTDL